MLLLSIPMYPCVYKGFYKKESPRVSRPVSAMHITQEMKIMHKDIALKERALCYAIAFFV